MLANSPTDTHEPASNMLCFRFPPNCHPVHLPSAAALRFKPGFDQQNNFVKFALTHPIRFAFCTCAREQSIHSMVMHLQAMCLKQRCRYGQHQRSSGHSCGKARWTPASGTMMRKGCRSYTRTISYSVHKHSSRRRFHQQNQVSMCKSDIRASDLYLSCTPHRYLVAPQGRNSTLEKGLLKLKRKVRHSLFAICLVIAE